LFFQNESSKFGEWINGITILKTLYLIFGIVITGTATDAGAKETNRNKAIEIIFVGIATVLFFSLLYIVATRGTRF
jgi:hypothetical protein